MNVSDDFATGTLGDQWTVAGPGGTSAGPGASATDGYLELVTPDGDHNVWGGANNGVRAMQATADTDFTLETGFLTILTERYQMQGLLVEQDADNWIRFDGYSSASAFYVCSAITQNGAMSVAFNQTVAPIGMSHLCLEWSGDTWVFEYSGYGENWVTVDTPLYALTGSAAGVFAGSTDGSTSNTAQVDYFYNTAAPLTQEDPPPVAGDDVVATGIDAAPTLDIATDLLVNDSDPQGAPLLFDGAGALQFGTLADNGDGAPAHAPQASFAGMDSFDCMIGTDTMSVMVAVPDPASAPPVNGGDTVTTQEDEAVRIAVLGNDLGLDDDPLMVVGTTDPDQGRLIDNGPTPMATRKVVHLSYITHRMRLSDGFGDREGRRRLCEPSGVARFLSRVCVSPSTQCEADPCAVAVRVGLGRRARREMSGLQVRRRSWSGTGSVHPVDPRSDRSGRPRGVQHTHMCQGSSSFSYR